MTAEALYCTIRWTGLGSWETYWKIRPHLPHLIPADMFRAAQMDEAFRLLGKGNV